MNTLNYNVDGLDEIIDERGNAIIALREVSWNSKPPKLELRKWYISDTGETVGKGVSFLTEEGPHQLVHALVSNGYGDTKTIVDILKTRDPNMSKELDEIELPEIKTSEDKEEYFDPKKLLGDFNE